MESFENELSKLEINIVKVNLDVILPVKDIIKLLVNRLNSYRELPKYYFAEKILYRMACKDKKYIYIYT